MPDNWTPTAKTFQQLFSCAPDRQLTIPRYQREYEWNNQDIELILSDLLEHSEFQYIRPLDDRVSYFLGTIVIHDMGQNRNVVDGQQRLTSITIIISALKDIFDLFHEHYPDEFRDPVLTLPGNDRPITPHVVRTVLEGMIQELQTGTQIPHLELKQLDAPRLNWIRKDWTDKYHQLCKTTFEWKIYNRRQGGLPEQGSANKPKKIYSNYLKIWELMGKHNPSDDSDFGALGILEKVYDGNGNVITTHPWNLQRIDKKPHWNIRAFQDCVATLQKITDLAYGIKDYTKVMEISVNEEWLAHTIFDRANTAGKKLAIIDVIRAKMFSKAAQLNANEATVDQIYNKMQQIYSINPERNSVNEFVKQYATMMSGTKVTGGGTQSHYTEAINAIATLQDLVSYVDSFVEHFDKYYNWIVKPDLVRDENNWIKAMCQDFAYTGFKQHRPLLLKAIMVQDASSENIILLQRTIESIYIIHNLIRESSPSAIESLMVDLISGITDNDSIESTSRTLFTQFKQKQSYVDTQDRARFVSELGETNFTQKQAHFILRNKIRIDADFNLANAPTTIVDATGGHVEHILPQDPRLWGEDWYDGQKTTTLHENFHERIGNLTILQASSNSSLGNKPWADKKIIYGAQDNGNFLEPELTNSLAQYEIWHSDQITERSELICEWVAQKWWDVVHPQDNEDAN